VKVELVKTFPLPAAPEAAWKLLQDVEAVAGCMPGAKITQRVDDTHYKGTVTVRVGPATLSFRGDIEVKEIDAATRTLRLYGGGSDTTGSSAGSMDLTARIDAAEGGRSTLNGQSIVSLSGKAAAFGGRMVNSVADQILGQFAGNFAARLPADAPQAAGDASASDAAAAEARASDGVAASQHPAAAAAPPPVAAELNGLALLWAVIRDWLRGIFAGRRA
jgi:carbon monoxide dehydrogenase subunit G